MLPRSLLVLLSLTTFLPGVAYSGDCFRNKASNPELLELFKKAAGDDSAVSKRFGNGVELCRASSAEIPSEARILELTRTTFTYSLFGGDHKCGVRFPRPQSVRDCIKDGPQGFTCAKGASRTRCCRVGFRKQMKFELTYTHPFLEGAEIVLSPDESRVAVRKGGDLPEQLVCDAGLLYF